MPTTPMSKTALMHTSTRVKPELIAKHTGAHKIRSMKHNGGWLHMIDCETPKEFDEYEAALRSIEGELKSKCFVPILDDEGSTEGKIILNPSFMSKFSSEEVWKRRSSEGERSPIPILKHVSKQVQVDFVETVHSTDAKRKREPATLLSSLHEPEIGEKKKKPAKIQQQQKEHPSAAAGGSSMDGFAGRALDAVLRSHADTVASKDETIKALLVTLAAKDELVRTQATLIAMLQK